MKRVININFQGRVIPIEESACNMLKQYVDSLRNFFENEEGKDEIINDIEGRIAELFSDILKKGSTCITEADVNGVMHSIGRPEDFGADDLGGTTNSQQQQQTYSSSTTTDQTDFGRGRLYRDEADKILGGVCAGLANYLKIDSTIIRILFAIITFGGFGSGFLIYILLWIILPSKSLQSTVRKRLYRNPDEKVIAGVASGIAAYFNIAVWIPRLIFAMPLVLGIFSSLFTNMIWEFDPFPSVIFGSFGSSLFIIYAVLWAVIPEARSASEKLEMRGEKVDLHTIKNTIQEDLEGFRVKAEKWGKEFGKKANEFGKEVSSTVGEKSAEVGKVAKRSGSRLGNAIAILFKAFFLFIFGIIAFALLMALLGVMIGGVSMFPLKDFFLEGFWQNFLAWSTLILFFTIPVIGMITWLVRRLMGVKSKGNTLGFAFGGLWALGWVAITLLAASLAKDFNGAVSREKNEMPLTQPSKQKMVIKVADSKYKTYGHWFKLDGLVNLTDDSIYLNNIKVQIVKSPDNNYHIFTAKYSAGSNELVASRYVKQMNYGFTQQDSIIYLDRGFALKRGARFRNQRVVVTIQVPVNGKIEIDKTVSRRLNYYGVQFAEDWDWEDEWYETEKGWRDNVEYIMTPGGLERVNKEKDEHTDFVPKAPDAPNPEEEKANELQKQIEEEQRQLDEKKKALDQLNKKNSNKTYRYKKTIAHYSEEPSEYIYSRTAVLMVPFLK